MPRTTAADAVASLQEALTELPSESDVRSEFFLQWRGRTADALDRIFHDDPEPVRQFKEIEFSPRRLSKDDAKDAQLKLDAYLAGCAAARTLLESLMWRLTTAGLPKEDKPIQTPPLTSQPMPTVAQPPMATVARAPMANVAQAPPPPQESIVTAPAPVHVIRRPRAHESKFSDSPVLAGAPMESREMCDPVRHSLARVLGAWDRGERDMALVLSAQLLADLTVLSRQERFKTAFEKVLSKASDPAVASTALDALKNAGPLCIWSMVAAMNEVMKN